VPHLNPGVDFHFENGDKLICISRDREASLTPDRRKHSKTWPRPERELEILGRDTLRVLVLGWSRRIPALLEELASYHNQLFEITIASREPLAERVRKSGITG
jgi:ion channel POLLUX/CASTOR